MVLSRRFIALLLFPLLLFSKDIDTFYGKIAVEEPVLIELIESPAFQRLKHIHHYGVSYYTTHREEFSRFDHCLGVFTILRVKGCSLKEQIAGLLHDVSHTVFSHVGDWVFRQENKEDGYQDLIHAEYLKACGIGEILQKHGYAVEEILPEEEFFPALECPLPSLCADRIDYNIQGAFHQKFITHAEALQILNDLQFIDNRWIFTNQELALKLARFSLFMTVDCWGSPTNYLISRWLADALIRAVELHLITDYDLHFGLDQTVWDTLMNQNDAYIAERMQRVMNGADYYFFTHESEADFVIRSKNRGINPWIRTTYGDKRLSEIDPLYASEYARVSEMLKKGWSVKVR